MRFIQPDAPWENGYVESLNGTLRVDLLDREVFGHRPEAKVLGEQYRQEYNTERLHSALDYQTPAEFAAPSALTTAPTQHSPWYNNEGQITQASPIFYGYTAKVQVANTPAWYNFTPCRKRVPFYCT